MTLDDLRRVPEPEVEALIASRRWALARLGRLPASWRPKVPAVHPSVAMPNLLRLVEDVAPAALADLDAKLKVMAEATKAAKAEKAQIKQLATIAHGGA